MDALAQKIIDAHGGLDRWKQFASLSAHLTQGGALWGLKGQAGKLDDANVTVGLTEQWASHHPFGTGERVTLFRPDRVEIKDPAGQLLEALDAPRNSFAGHTFETPWTEPQLAYFAGVAMWTYFNLPFLLAADGVASERLEDWQEQGESWQRLRVTFPKGVATHSAVQTLYLDDAGLIRRHDYDVEIAGDTPGAHYPTDYVEVQGIKFPTKRRIFPRGPDGVAMAEPLVVSIDIDQIVLR